MVEGIQAKTIAVEAAIIEKAPSKKEDTAKEGVMEVEAHEKEAMAVPKEVLVEATGKGQALDTTA